MIEKAIENWLTNTNERNYQVAFCQVLLSKGHRILHVSSHRPMEQGKDIITIDGDEYCAYQLKTGDIDLREWRRILGEVKELIELPFVHPSLKKTKVHKSFLVTNGSITDEVRFQIDQINQDNIRKQRGYSYLDVINGKTLLKDFIDTQGKFIPTELEDFNAFLELFLADGTDFLEKGRLFDFLNRAIFNKIPKQKSNSLSAISSSIIVTAYILNHYQVKGNFYAIFEAWVSLAACILRYALRTGLKKEDWADSYNLVISEITRNLSLLKEEVLRREDFLEGDLLGDGGVIYWARVTIILGTLATLQNHFHATKDSYKEDEELSILIKKNLRFLWFWGESAFPYFFNLIKYWELNNESQIAQTQLNDLFLHIIEWNSPRSKKGRANPYYTVNDILEVVLGIDMKKIDLAQFSGSSYILEPLILMIARRNGREILEKNWQAVSHILFNKFMCDRIEDIFTWRTKEGYNHWEFPEATQSWFELVRESKNLDKIPDLFLEYQDLLHFFILVCPHRISKEIIGLLDLMY